MTRSLDAFPDDFWYVQSWPLKWSDGRPTSVEQALHEMYGPEWYAMVDIVFEDFTANGVTVDDVMTLIRETNTCEGLNSALDVWVDESGDYKIKVYYEVL